MSVLLEASRDKPLGLWDLSGSSPFTDRSGYGNSGTLGGTIVRHASLGNGLGSAAIVNNTNKASFAFATFTTGLEERSFSLEAIVRPISRGGTGEQQILGHASTYDGLVINGTVISFVTKYTNTGEARASYDLGTLRSVVAEGVHTRKKNSLIVNGELVAEVDITIDQQKDTYLTAGTTLSSGETTSGNDLALNMVAVYNYPLSTDFARRHAVIARRCPDPGNVAQQFGGTRIVLPGSEGDIYMEHVIDEDHEWNDGLLINTVAKDGVLYPVVDGQSLPGYWLGAVPIDATSSSSIYGVILSWEGKGEVVECSLDGISWSTVSKGQLVPQISSGFNPANKVLHVRVSFAGYVENDESYVSNFRATGLLTASHSVEGMTVTKVGTPTLGRYFHHIDYADAWGITTNGTTDALRISAPDGVGSGEGIGTIELWVKNLSAAAPAMLADTRVSAGDTQSYFYRSSGTNWTFGNSTVYLNGASFTNNTTWRSNEWTLVHIVKNVLTPSLINIGQNLISTERGKFQIGHVALYGKQLTATEISNIYQTYTGVPTTRANDNSVIAMSVPGDGATIYAFDWSIQPAG